MSVTISELYGIKNEKDKNKLKTYNIISELCIKKIKRVASTNGNETFYSIPFVLIGLPLYNINECVKHIILMLKKGGFFVQRLPNDNNNIIYISWKIEDVSNKNKKLSLNFNQI